jgi:hypothetical protein
MRRLQTDKEPEIVVGGCMVGCGWKQMWNRREQNDVYRFCDVVQKSDSSITEGSNNLGSSSELVKEEGICTG